MTVKKWPMRDDDSSSVFIQNGFHDLKNMELPQHSSLYQSGFFIYKKYIIEFTVIFFWYGFFTRQ